MADAHCSVVHVPAGAKSDPWLECEDWNVCLRALTANVQLRRRVLEGAHRAAGAHDPSPTDGVCAKCTRDGANPGCNGMCSTCFLEKMGIPNLNGTVSIGSVDLTPLDVVTSVALGQSISDNAIDGMIELLKCKVPPEMCLLNSSDAQLLRARGGVGPTHIARFQSALKNKAVLLLPWFVKTPPHWELVAVHQETRCMCIYDSLSIEADVTSLQTSLNTLTGDSRAWRVESPPCGKQNDGTSCGAFVIHHMKLLILGVETTESNVPERNSDKQTANICLIRSQMARELLNGRLDAGVALVNKRYPV